jgi:hypothetical protein
MYTTAIVLSIMICILTTWISLWAQDKKLNRIEKKLDSLQKFDNEVTRTNDGDK